MAKGGYSKGKKTGKGLRGMRDSNPIVCWDGKKQGPSSKNKGFGPK